LKVEACRSFYSIRGFSFFGVDNCLTIFNHLCSNYKSYEKALTKDLFNIFENRNFYEFLKSHSYKFENLKMNDKFLGVIYKENGNLTLIEKKQFSLLEYNSVKKDDDINKILLNIEFNKKTSFNSFELVKARCEYAENLVQDFYEEKKKKGFNIVLKNGENFDGFNYLDLCADEENKGNLYFNDENTANIISYQCINNNKLDILLNTVILIQHYSSKSSIDEILKAAENIRRPEIQSNLS